MGLFKKKPFKKITEKAKGIGKKINTFTHTKLKTKGLIKKAIKGVKNGIDDAALIPFVLPMKSALRTKGVTSFPNDRKKLAQLFISKVVNGSKNFENFDRERAKPFEVETEVNSFFENAEGEEGEGQDAKKTLADASNVAGIIKIVVDFFKGLKKKKEAGEPLNPLEEKLAEASEQIDESVESATGSSILKGATGAMDWNKILLYVGIAIVAVVVLKKFL